MIPAGAATTVSCWALRKATPAPEGAAGFDRTKYRLAITVSDGTRFIAAQIFTCSLGDSFAKWRNGAPFRARFGGVSGVGCGWEFEPPSYEEEKDQFEPSSNPWSPEGASENQRSIGKLVDAPVAAPVTQRRSRKAHWPLRSEGQPKRRCTRAIPNAKACVRQCASGCAACHSMPQGRAARA